MCRYISAEEKLDKELAKYKIPCKCGRKIIFYPTTQRDFLICSWCGNKVYKNKKCEFRDKLKILKRKKEILDVKSNSISRKN